jgi:hypothetical protein
VGAGETDEEARRDPVSALPFESLPFFLEFFRWLFLSRLGFEARGAWAGMHAHSRPRSRRKHGARVRDAGIVRALP